MLTSPRLPLPSLIELCRTLRHYLGAGLTVRDVFRKQATQGSVALKTVAGRMDMGFQRGEDMETMLHQERAAFPPLFLALASVGEHSGNLPEIFGELEKYYRMQQRLQRQFWSQSAWPIFQFVLAIFVVAGLIWILGMLASNPGPNGRGPDPLGWGLSGERGALTFLFGAFGSVALLIGVYYVVTRTLRQRPHVDALLLRVPALGPCLDALALSRFCLSMRLTLDTSIPIDEALRLSLRATGNAAYEARTDTIVQVLKEGDELALALTRAGGFNEEFLQIIAVGEESGRLPEVLKNQAKFYEEESERRLTFLTKAASWGVWLVVASIMIYMMYRIFTTSIAPAYNV